MADIPKTIRVELPETEDGLREYIELSRREIAKIQKRIGAVREMLIEKEKGKRL